VAAPRRQRSARAQPDAKAARRRACGLCGGGDLLTRTECCNRWACGGCARDHRRYTLCGLHAVETHAGSWKSCPRCRQEHAAELYVYLGTNEYNFEKLEDPPTFAPTLCAKCRRVIHLARDGYSLIGDAYLCGRCSVKGPRRNKS